MKLPFTLKISQLVHTWFIDIDGTLLEHNGHLLGEDRLLPGVSSFWAEIPPNDKIILLSAREDEYAGITLELFHKYGLRYDHAIFGLPSGERIIINDRKPNGLITAVALNLERDKGLQDIQVAIDSTI